MEKFIVIDIASQVNEVNYYIKDWNKSDILTWLSQFGEINKIDNLCNENLYGFRSHSGIGTGFELLVNQMVVLGSY